MGNKIEKKVWPKYFQSILDGKKTYELRLADFDINEGDTLILKEWNPEQKNILAGLLRKK